METSVAVIIPALDEADNLPLVLSALPEVDEVVVVDNGSTDGTAEVARRCPSRAHRQTVITEPRRGYGTAVRAGMDHLANTHPPEVVVILDADFADHPELLGRLVAPILADEADLALSDRTQTAQRGALSIVQVLGNRFANALITAVSGHRFRDMGPFRAIRWSSLVAMEMSDPTWGWNVEMHLKAVNRSLRVIEIPMPYRRRRHGRSKISGTLIGTTRAGYRILQAVARYRDA